VSPSDAIIALKLFARSILQTGTRAGPGMFRAGGSSCGIFAYFQVREIERLGSNEEHRGKRLGALVF
jgi:hypothetical protein